MGDDKPDYTIGVDLLTQTVASLTAVVSAVALDIRALNESDIAHLSLPYNYKTVLATNEDAISHDNSETVSLDDSDWGTGKDYYVVGLVILFNFTVNNYYKYWHGVGVQSRENEGGERPEIFYKTYNPLTDPPYRASEGGNGFLRRTEKADDNKVDSTSDLDTVFYNYSGADMQASTMQVRYIGVAITP